MALKRKQKTTDSKERASIWGVPLHYPITTPESRYHALAWRIVTQALLDLETLNRYKTDELPMPGLGVITRNELWNFFTSEWFRELTGCDKLQQRRFLNHIGLYVSDKDNDLYD